MNLLVFAFRHTIAEEVLDKLPSSTKKVLLDSLQESIEQFIKSDLSAYTHIIGMGVYSDRDQSKIRIETACSSQFRNNKRSLEVLAITYFFNPNDYMKLASGIGNSWCNLVSYSLVKAHSSLRYTFLHIPKSFNVRLATQAIVSQVEHGELLIPVFTANTESTL